MIIKPLFVPSDGFSVTPVCGVKKGDHVRVVGLKNILAGNLFGRTRSLSFTRKLGVVRRNNILGQTGIVSDVSQNPYNKKITVFVVFPKEICGEKSVYKLALHNVERI